MHKDLERVEGVDLQVDVARDDVGEVESVLPGQG
jgi:hypothetical protein